MVALQEYDGAATQTPLTESEQGQTKQVTLRDVGVFVSKYLIAVLVIGLPLGIWLAIAELEGNVLAVNALQRPLIYVLGPGALLYALIATKKVPRGTLWTAKELWSPGALLAFFLGFVLQIAMVWANDPFARVISGGDWLSLWLKRGTVSLTMTDLLLTTVGACILTPLAEEWAFRGFLQPVLVRQWGSVAGIIVTALSFVLLHKWSVINVLSLGLMAVILGCVAHRRITLTYCILIHAGFNLAAVVPRVWLSLSHLKVIGL